MQAKDLDQFTKAYLQCALYTETDNRDDSGGEPLDHNYDIWDFSPKAIEKAYNDCKAFQAEYAYEIAETPAWEGVDSYTSEGYTGLECAAHDFWYTRVGAGVGFWDREYYTQEVRDRLTKASKAYGECYVYIGDDNKLYLA
jgi:hypothetical protein